MRFCSRFPTLAMFGMHRVNRRTTTQAFVFLHVFISPEQGQNRAGVRNDGEESPERLHFEGVYVNAVGRPWAGVPWRRRSRSVWHTSSAPDVSRHRFQLSAPPAARSNDTAISRPRATLDTGQGDEGVIRGNGGTPPTAIVSQFSSPACQRRLLYPFIPPSSAGFRIRR